MSVAERFFVWCRKNEVDIGSRVEWDEHSGYTQLSAGSGAVELVWFGIEEALKVRLDDGTLVHLYPAEGIHNVRGITPPGGTE